MIYFYQSIIFFIIITAQSQPSSIKIERLYDRDSIRGKADKGYLVRYFEAYTILLNIFLRQCPMTIIV